MKLKDRKVEFVFPQFIDYDQFRDLQNLMQRKKILFNEFPAPVNMRTHLMKPYAYFTCARCGSATETFAHPHIDLCLSCYKNNTDIPEYRRRAVAVLMGRCERCKRNFNTGIRVYNVRICLKCLLTF